VPEEIVVGTETQTPVAGTGHKIFPGKNIHRCLNSLTIL